MLHKPAISKLQIKRNKNKHQDILLKYGLKDDVLWLWQKEVSNEKLILLEGKELKKQKWQKQYIRQFRPLISKSHQLKGQVLFVLIHQDCHQNNY